MPKLIRGEGEDGQVARELKIVKSGFCLLLIDLKGHQNAVKNDATQCICTFVFKNYLLAQFIHLREVPDSCASQGGCVLNQHHLPLVLLHAHHLPVQGLCPDVVEGHVAADVCSRCPPAADCTLSWQLLKPPLLMEVSGTCRCLL